MTLIATQDSPRPRVGVKPLPRGGGRGLSGPRCAPSIVAICPCVEAIA